MLFLIGEFMNLIHACEYKQVQFDERDGFTLAECRETINDVLALSEFDEDTIAQFWTGERQLTTS